MTTCREYIPNVVIAAVFSTFTFRAHSNVAPAELQGGIYFQTLALLRTEYIVSHRGADSNSVSRGPTVDGTT